MSVDDVMRSVDTYGCNLVEITGGEPLLQEDVYPLMKRLLASGKTVMVETGGHLSVKRRAGRRDPYRGRQMSRRAASRTRITGRTWTG